MSALLDAEQRAIALLSLIVAGDWQHAHAEFADAMASALDEHGLAKAWKRVNAHAGHYLGHGTATARQVGAFTSVMVPLKFDNIAYNAEVAFEAGGKVAGLHFAPSAAVTSEGLQMPSGQYVLRCSDGHVYAVSRSTLLFQSVHIGATQFRPCPVDRKWRSAEFVYPAVLTEAELAEAISFAV